MTLSTYVLRGTGRHPPDCKAEDEKGDQAVEQQTLPRVPSLGVTPEKRHDQRGSQPVKHVNGIIGTLMAEEEDQAKGALNHDEHLPDNQGASDVSSKRSTSCELKQPPQTDKEKKEHNGGREAIVKQVDDAHECTFPEKHKVPLSQQASLVARRSQYRTTTADHPLGIGVSLQSSNER